MFDFQAPAPKAERQDAVLAFNRLNGVFIAAFYHEFDKCDHENVNVIYVQDEMDIFNDEVDGGLIINEDGTWSKNYTILTKEDAQRKIYEAQLDNQMAYKITQRYPIAEQVNVLSRAIKLLAEKAEIALPELDEMLDYIKLCKDTSRNHKEFYRDSPDFIYVTNEQEAERNAAAFEGGLHEAIGPRPIEGGRVFS